MNLARKSGEFVERIEGNDLYKAFVPNPLPPNPPIHFNVDLSILMDKANRSLGRLDGVTSQLPNPMLFTTFYIRKEALLSSQIEGTKSTFSDLLIADAEGMQDINFDTRMVFNYVYTLQFGIHQLRQSEQKIITLELLTTLHERLMADTKKEKSAGRLKLSQNWSGDGVVPSKAKMVYTPPDETLKCLNNLLDFLNNIPERTPVLLKAAIAHVQFESIHPFEDGNGRIGRILIVLLLCVEKALEEPMLYLSLYFKTNYSAYIENLQKVRLTGDWESWLEFFFQGVLEVSQESVETAKSILKLFETNKRRIDSLRTTNSVQKIHEHLQISPMMNIKQISKALNMSIPSITSGLKQLESLGIVQEKTGNSRNRLFAYQEYINLLSVGTKPIEKD